MALLDHRLQRARHADAVAAHDARDAFAVFIEERRTERFAVFGAQLEHVADLDCAANLQRLSGLDAQLAGLDLAQIRPLADRDISLDVDVAQVVAVVVRAGNHTGAAAQNLVGVNWDAVDTNRAQATRLRAKRLDDLGIARRAKRFRTQRAAELGLLELVVAAQ